jgi:hypothetical protein
MQSHIAAQVQSFRAVLEVRVYERPFPMAPPASARLLHSARFEGAALEFGGAYVCPEAMPQLKGVLSEGVGASKAEEVTRWGVPGVGWWGNRGWGQGGPTEVAAAA